MSAAVLLSLLLALTASPAAALVIYRIGGQDLPPPSRADAAGVQFVQRGWQDLDVDAGAVVEDLDLSREAIRALRRDPGANIVPGIEARGGSIPGGSVKAVWDGDASTVWAAELYVCSQFSRGEAGRGCIDEFGTPGTATVVLDGLYRLHHVRVVSGLRDPSRIVAAVRVFVSRQPPPTYNPAYGLPPFTPWLVEVRDNREPVLDIPIPSPQEVGFVQVAIAEHDDPWDVHEIGVYAEGYVARSTWVSNVLDLGRPMAWGQVRWSGQRDGDAQVLIQSRSGVDDDPVVFWRYTGRGLAKEPVARSQYPGLAVGERAGTSADLRAWSPWSAPYPFGDSLGTPITSPGPRRFVQLRVDFLPQGDAGGRVGVLEFEASAPVATALVGEVWPVTAAVGQPTPFTYALRPTIAAGDAGFDRLELRSLSLLGAVRQVRVADEVVPFRVEQADSHRVVLGLARLGPVASGALVEVEFEAQVLRYGATFDARVADSAQPLEVPQSVVPGDATGQYDGDRVSVTTAGQARALLRLRAAPDALTPNGDGINDEARLVYGLYEIIGSASVQVAVWDLSGRRVRLLEDGDRGIGEYRTAWDGRDDAGRLVAPGLYPVRATAATDTDQAEEVRVLAVAY